MNPEHDANSQSALESELRGLRLAFDFVRDEVAHLDSNRRLTYANRAMIEFLLRSPDEVVGLTCAELFPDLCMTDCPHARVRTSVAIEQMAEFGGQARGVTVVATANGNVVHISRAPNPRNAESASSDLLRPSSRNTANAVLGGIAHELNNPLTVVIAYADILSQMEETAPFRDEVQQILRNALRCQSIVRNLVAFARDDRPGNIELNVNRLVRETIPPFAYRWKVGGVRLDQRPSATDPLIRGDRSRLQVALVNILNNAYTAARVGGQGGLVRIGTKTQGRNVEIAIADDGPGMSKEAIAEVMGPRRSDLATDSALGLKLVRAIAVEHGGDITIDSDGHGTTVTIILPAAGYDQMVADRQLEPGCLTGLRMLVVDDEPDVRGLVSTALEMYGASVNTAASGREALAMLRDDARFDVLLSDLRMPDMGGDSLVEALRIEFPQLVERVILTTGDLAASRDSDELRRSGRPCLPKPFIVYELVGMLLEIVGRK